MKKEEILDKIYKNIEKYNNNTVENITLLDDRLEISDCYMHVASKIKIDDYVNGDKNISLLYIDVRCKMKNYYISILKETILRGNFDKHYNFVMDTFSNLTKDERLILLYYIDNKYKRYMDLSFLKGSHHNYKKKYFKRIKNKLCSENLIVDIISMYDKSGYKNFTYSEIPNDKLLYGEQSKKF